MAWGPLERCLLLIGVSVYIKGMARGISWEWVSSTRTVHLQSGCLVV